MIVEEGTRFAVRVDGRCYGKYRLMSRALQRQDQVFFSQRLPDKKARRTSQAPWWKEGAA